MTGTVDPEIYLPKMLDELDEAGLLKLQQTLQLQINAWLRKS